MMKKVTGGAGIGHSPKATGDGVVLYEAPGCRLTLERGALYLEQNGGAPTTAGALEVLLRMPPERLPKLSAGEHNSLTRLLTQQYEVALTPPVSSSLGPVNRRGALLSLLLELSRQEVQGGSGSSAIGAVGELVAREPNPWLKEFGLLYLSQLESATAQSHVQTLAKERQAPPYQAWLKDGELRLDWVVTDVDSATSKENQVNFLKGIGFKEEPSSERGVTRLVRPGPPRVVAQVVAGADVSRVLSDPKSEFVVFTGHLFEGNYVNGPSRSTGQNQVLLNLKCKGVRDFGQLRQVYPQLQMVGSPFYTSDSFDQDLVASVLRHAPATAEQPGGSWAQIDQEVEAKLRGTIEKHGLDKTTYSEERVQTHYTFPSEMAKQAADADYDVDRLSDASDSRFLLPTEGIRSASGSLVPSRDDAPLDAAPSYLGSALERHFYATLGGPELDGQLAQFRAQLVQKFPGWGGSGAAAPGGEPFSVAPTSQGFEENQAFRLVTQPDGRWSATLNPRFARMDTSLLFGKLCQESARALGQDPAVGTLLVMASLPWEVRTDRLWMDLAGGPELRPPLSAQWNQVVDSSGALGMNDATLSKLKQLPATSRSSAQVLKLEDCSGKQLSLTRLTAEDLGLRGTVIWRGADGKGLRVVVRAGADVIEASLAATELGKDTYLLREAHAVRYPGAADPSRSTAQLAAELFANGGVSQTVVDAYQAQRRSKPQQLPIEALTEVLTQMRLSLGTEPLSTNWEKKLLSVAQEGNDTVSLVQWATEREADYAFSFLGPFRRGQRHFDADFLGAFTPAFLSAWDGRKQEAQALHDAVLAGIDALPAGRPVPQLVAQLHQGLIDARLTAPQYFSLSGRLVAKRIVTTGQVTSATLDRAVSKLGPELENLPPALKSWVSEALGQARVQRPPDAGGALQGWVDEGYRAIGKAIGTLPPDKAAEFMDRMNALLEGGRTSLPDVDWRAAERALQAGIAEGKAQARRPQLSLTVGRAGHIVG